MLEWTGERFLPWLDEAAIAYEHLHRYAYASQFVEGKRVLDLATGEGYGANLLARKASSVTAMDLDQATIRHASDKYDQTNLRFLVGPITDVPIPESKCFDVIVCFEAIEHIEEHERLLREIKRLLVEDGLFIVSTPNKDVYKDESEVQNPFHVKELNFEEFSQLLDHYFKRICYLGQRIYCNSNMWPVPGETAEEDRKVAEFLLEKRSEFTLTHEDQRIPHYFIAIATDGAAEFDQLGSILVDTSDEFIQQSKREIAEMEKALEWKDSQIRSQEEGLTWREHQLTESQKTIHSQEEALAWRADQIRSQEEALAWRADQVRSQEEALAWRSNEARQLNQQVNHLGLEKNKLWLEKNKLTEELNSIKSGLGWKFLTQLRALKETLLPTGSSRRKWYDGWRQGGH